MVIIARDMVREPLYAVVPYVNQWRWKSRVKHTERAIKHVHDSGATIVLVEVAFNRCDFVFADSGLDGTATNCPLLGGDNKYRHKYIGLRSSSELWLKESAINIGVQNLPDDFEQVCWLDSDVHFIRPNWVGEAVHKLQHGAEHDIAFLQMFSHARDLSPSYEILPESYPHADGVGFAEAWKRGLITSNGPALDSRLPATVMQQVESAGGYYGKITRPGQVGPTKVFPGLAWACTRNAWEAVGGLFDAAVWGGGDWHMSHALIEKKEGMMRKDLHPSYQKLVMEWYDRCVQYVRQNVLVMEGSILHHWHGMKEQRGYNTKHALLAKVGFDPLRHLKRDTQGLYMLHDDGSDTYVQLRDMMRKVARERDEDSTYTGLSRDNQGH